MSGTNRQINKRLGEYERKYFEDEKQQKRGTGTSQDDIQPPRRPRSRLAASLDDFVEDVGGRKLVSQRPAPARYVNSDDGQQRDFSPPPPQPQTGNYGRSSSRDGSGRYPSKSNLKKTGNASSSGGTASRSGSAGRNAAASDQQQGGGYDASCTSSVSSIMTMDDGLNGGGGSKTNRDVLPLPIDIPDTVSNAEAFRRYLSTRRNAIDAGYDKPDFPSSGDVGGRKRDRRGAAAAAINRQQGQSTSANRRTVALSHALMTLALLSASASQLRFVIAYSSAHAFPALNYFLVCTCILIEVIVGIGYVVLGRFDFTERTADRIHSFLIFGLFVVAISNVIVAAFAIDDHVCEVIARQSELNYQELISQKNQQAEAKSK